MSFWIELGFLIFLGETVSKPVAIALGVLWFCGKVVEFSKGDEVEAK